VVYLDKVMECENGSEEVWNCKSVDLGERKEVCMRNGKGTRRNSQERYRSLIRHRGGRIRRPTFDHRTDERFNRLFAFE
jgi:hypothetical protein